MSKLTIRDINYKRTDGYNNSNCREALLLNGYTETLDSYIDMLHNLYMYVFRIS